MLCHHLNRMHVLQMVSWDAHHNWQTLVVEREPAPHCFAWRHRLVREKITMLTWKDTPQHLIKKGMWP